jgi:hypothetical protein
MQVTAADIKDFQALYLKHFNIELTKSSARVKLMMLVRQLEVTYRPITKAQLDKLQHVNGNVSDEQVRPASNR